MLTVLAISELAARGSLSRAYGTLDSLDFPGAEAPGYWQPSASRSLFSRAYGTLDSLRSSRR